MGPQQSQQPQQPNKPQPKLHTKPLIIAGIAAGVILVVGTALAIAWPKKKPAPPPPPPETVTQYYYVDEIKGEDGKKDSFNVTLAFADPKTGSIQKQDLKTAWPLLWDNAIQFTADGSRYVYATIDQGDKTDPAKPVAPSFQLVTGQWPQQKLSERVLLSDIKRAEAREWLLTGDGKELIYLDIIMNDKKEITASDLYSLDVASGKSTKIGAIDRPTDRENTRLHEFTKDKTVRYYTSRDDGIYETRYDRTTRKLTHKKVIIRDYDLGSMGFPSPDGTKMLYFGNGVKDFTVYLLDLVEGGATPLISTPSKYGGYRDGHWSPDSKSVALVAEIKDIDGKHYENQMILVDTVVKSTATDMISRNKSPGTDNSLSRYAITSWSVDGNYLTYVQNKQLHFYDITKRKILDTVKVGHEVDPNSTILGWVTKIK